MHYLYRGWLFPASMYYVSVTGVSINRFALPLGFHEEINIPLRIITPAKYIIPSWREKYPSSNKPPAREDETEKAMERRSISTEKTLPLITSSTHCWVRIVDNTQFDPLAAWAKKTSTNVSIKDISKENDSKTRIGGTIASSIFLMMQGIQILRIHDVNEVMQGIKVFRKLIKN